MVPRDVGPGACRGGFRGGAEAERGEPVFVRLFDFVAAFAAVVARAVRVGVGVGVSAIRGVDASDRGHRRLVPES